DPSANRTTSSYADSWANSACAPTGGSGAAYRTTVTDALNHSSHATYNSCTGTLASSTDQNGQTTTFHYDALERLTEIDLPDGGKQLMSYASPTQQILSVLRDTSPSNVYVVTTFNADALGREKSHVLADFTGNDDTVDTTYDALGRVASVSNPHRPGFSETDGLTTYTYDSLNRPLTISKKDDTTHTSSSSY